jgi:glucose/arabinose dehydrogenase
MVRAAAVVLVLAALLAPASARASDTTLPEGFTETTEWTLPAGEAATALRFAPDGHVFVAAKSGRVYEFDGRGDATPALVADLSREVYDSPTTDRGLLGLAVDPGYASGRPYLYVAYTYDESPTGKPDPEAACHPADEDFGSCTVLGRVSRLDLASGGAETVLVQDFCDQFQSHTMGTLAFGPDGMLYAGAGDGAAYDSIDTGQRGDPVNACGDPPGEGGALRAQSYRRPSGEPVSLDGSLIRIDPDHPTAPSRSPIVAYGLRNPFRFTFRPGTGDLWIGDVGFDTWEEIDRMPDLSQVRNYGWPCYEGDSEQPLYHDAGLGLCDSLYAADDTVKPVLAYQHGTPLAGCPQDEHSAISGLAFYDATAFPARYRGALFFADFSRDCIWTMFPGADGLPDPATTSLFASGAAMPVDLEVGPDGALYYADVYGGEIRRIAALPPAAPPPAAATPAPIATPTATPTVTPRPRALPRLHAPRRLTMSRHGVVTVRLSCPAAKCRFTARLTYHRHMLGRASGAHALRIRLSHRGRRLVRRHAKLRLTVTRRVGSRTQSAARTLRVRR